MLRDFNMTVFLSFCLSNRSERFHIQQLDGELTHRSARATRYRRELGYLIIYHRSDYTSQ